MQGARLKHLGLKYSVVFYIRNRNASVSLRFFFYICMCLGCFATGTMRVMKWKENKRSSRARFLLGKGPAGPSCKVATVCAFDFLIFCPSN